jgi:tungstate transport system substrate-binding protein
MYNDFVLVGPKSDPAGVKGGGADILSALSSIEAAEAVFASRGDDSGTHKAEMGHWADAGLDPTSASGEWYRETGSGMGATLNIASGMGAYALTDRATWLSFGNRGDLEILVEGDPRLFNQYGVILVNPERHPKTRANAGQRFIDWLTGPDGQAAIADFRLEGQQVFFPNAQ